MELRIKHATIHIGGDTQIRNMHDVPASEGFTKKDMDNQFGLGFNAGIAEVAINWNEGGPERVHTMLGMHPAVDADSLRPVGTNDPHHNEPEGTGETFGGLKVDGWPFQGDEDGDDVPAAAWAEAVPAAGSGEPEKEAEPVAPEDAVIAGTYRIDAVELAGIRQAEYERGVLEGQTRPREISHDVFLIKLAEAFESMENAQSLTRVQWREEYARRLLTSLNMVVR